MHFPTMKVRALKLQRAKALLSTHKTTTQTTNSHSRPVLSYLTAHWPYWNLFSA